MTTTNRPVSARARGNFTTRVTVGVLAVGAAGAMGILGGVGSGTAEAATCGLPDAHGVTHCSDGSYQYVDGRGHLIIKNAAGKVIRDLPPNVPWY